VNHTSNADPWICCGSFFPWETKYVLKKDLLSLPIVGWVIQLAGDLPIRFTKEKGKLL
jgi:1-acyl-sn-glycerol-3-phosphate acyltransferase